MFSTILKSGVFRHGGGRTGRGAAGHTGCAPSGLGVKQAGSRTVAPSVLFVSCHTADSSSPSNLVISDMFFAVYVLKTTSECAKNPKTPQTHQ